MFDLRVPESLAYLPGRFVGLCWDEDDLSVKKLPTPKITLTTEQRLEIKRQKDRDYYAKNRLRIRAQQNERNRRKSRAKQTPEQRAAVKAAYWANNRERIAKRRKELVAQKRNPQQQLRASNRSN